MTKGVLLGTLCVLLSACSGTTALTETERQKLDPQLIMLLSGDAVSDSDYDSSLRGDGTKEYAVIIRSENVEEFKRSGIQVGSAFSDVITARVTLKELRKVLALSSVRAVQASLKNHPQ